jgi:hypothetical protein
MLFNLNNIVDGLTFSFETFIKYYTENNNGRSTG